MVSKRYSYNEQNMPPPMNKSWWEALLAEDEAQHAQTISKSSRPGRGGTKIY